MSEKLGPRTFESSDEVFIGNSIGHTKEYSEEIAAAIDEEVRTIVTDAYEKTRNILRDNQDRLDYIAKALMEYETLDGKQFEEAFEMRLPLESNDEALVETQDEPGIEG